MPVMCILRVLGFPEIIVYPLLPLIADPLLPEDVDWGPPRCLDGAGVLSLQVDPFYL